MLLQHRRQLCRSQGLARNNQTTWDSRNRLFSELIPTQAACRYTERGPGAVPVPGACPAVGSARGLRSTGPAPRGNTPGAGRTPSPARPSPRPSAPGSSRAEAPGPAAPAPPGPHHRRPRREGKGEEPVPVPGQAVPGVPIPDSPRPAPAAARHRLLTSSPRAGAARGAGTQRAAIGGGSRGRGPGAGGRGRFTAPCRGRRERPPGTRPEPGPARERSGVPECEGL